MALKLSHEFAPGYAAEYWRVKRVTLNKTKDTPGGAGNYGVSALLGLWRDKEAAESGVGALAAREVTFTDTATITELTEVNAIRWVYNAIKAGKAEEPELWIGAVDA